MFVVWACEKYRNRAGMKTQKDYPAGCCSKVMVKKEKKTILFLLPDYAIDVQ